MAWDSQPNYAPGNLTVNEGYAPAYQASGKPFVTGSVAVTVSGVEIKFPTVTRWVQVTNTGNADLRVGFSANGVHTSSCYYDIQQRGAGAGSGTSVRWELKCKSLFFHSTTSTTVSVVAGLTSIKDLNSPLSGSAGVM